MFKQVKLSGFCIGCRRKIPLNSLEPYCPICYMTYKNCGMGFFCHVCGANASISFNNPTCHSCYMTQQDCKIIKENNVSGFCIACGEEIELNPKRPYCLACYTDYVGWGIGFYCHICGGDGEGRIHSEHLVCRTCTEETGKEFKKHIPRPISQYP